MPKDFLSDDEMNAMNAPDFISDADMARLATPSVGGHATLTLGRKAPTLAERAKQVALAPVDYVRGTTKGALKTGTGVAELLGVDVSPDWKAALEPENTAQSVGTFVEKVAEAAIPATKIAKIPSMLGRASASGATSGALQAANSGKVDENTAVAATIGAVAEPVVQYVPSLIASRARATYGRLFPSGDKKNPAYKTAVELLAKEKVVGSAEKIREKAFQKLGDLAAMLDDAYTKIDPQKDFVPIDDLIGLYDDAKAQLVTSPVLLPNGSAVQVAKGQASQAAIKHIDEMKEPLLQLKDAGATQVRMTHLRQLRQDIDEVLGEGNFKDVALRAKSSLEDRIDKNLRSSLSKIIHDASPDVAALDAEYSSWRTIRNLVGKMKFTDAGRVTGVLSQSTAGFVLGAASGRGDFGDRLERGLYTAGLLGSLRTAFASPRYASLSGSLKQRLADFMAGGRVKEAELIAARLAALTRGGEDY